MRRRLLAAAVVALLQADGAAGFWQPKGRGAPPKVKAPKKKELAKRTDWVGKAEDAARSSVERVKEAAARFESPVDAASCKAFVGGAVLGVALTVGFALSPVSESVYLANGESREVAVAAAQFESVLYALERGYVDVVDPTELFETAVEAMLETLDPYTEFEKVQAAKDLTESVEGRYGGVGLVIAKRPDTEGVGVVEAFEGYSWESGLRPGDLIMKIGDTPIGPGVTLDEVRNLLRGSPGSKVDVEFTHAWNRGVTEKVSLDRSVVVKRDVELATILGPPGDRIAVAKVSGFSRVTDAELRAALRFLREAVLASDGDSADAEGLVVVSGNNNNNNNNNNKDKNDLKGIVLDLRGNPGGLLDSAIDVASLFLPPGSPVVSAGGRGFFLTQGAGADARADFTSAPSAGDFAGVPLVILVDGQTASASEIVAGAVQDLDAGLVVGTKTFGKGLVQDVAQLPFDAKLKVTVGRYYTPSGRCLQALDYKRDGDGGEASKEEGALRTGTNKVKMLARSETATAQKDFTTRSGRLVKDGGGVTPDVVVKSDRETLSKAEAVLLSRGTINDFANAYSKAHADEAVKLYAASAGRAAGAPQPKLLNSKDLADLRRLAEKAVDDVEGLDEKTRKELQAELRTDFAASSKSQRVKRLAEATLRARFFRNTDNLRADLDEDKQLAEATRLLRDRSRYDALLKPPRA